jgi:hypothetical protein
MISAEGPGAPAAVLQCTRGVRMSEILETATGSLSDYTKKLEIAMFFTNGDEERAKQMLAGNLEDVCVIKGRFSSTQSFGVFIAFFNRYYLTLNSVYPIISDAFDLKDIKTNVDWKHFEKDLVDFMGKNLQDDVLGRQFKSIFLTSFTVNFAGELKKLLDGKIEIDINRVFQLMVQDRMGLQGVNMMVDTEFISSLDMETDSLTSRKIMDYKQHQENKKEGEVNLEIDTDNDREALKGKEVKLILRGSLILSPISGRDIGLLVVGDRLKVKIVDIHPRAVQVAKAFNAYTENGIQPIAGRIVFIRRRTDGGYTIFVAVARGIYVKVEEMEESIKVAIDTSYMDVPAPSDNMSKITMGIIGALAVLLVGLIIFMIILFK